MDFESLYRSYATDVYRFSLFLCGRPEEADDITAETFVRALTSREPIRVGTVKAFLFMIARNLYRASYRRTAREAAVDPAALHESVADPRGDPEVMARGRDELMRVLEAMQSLPEIDRAAVLMRAHDDLSYEQVAAALGITVAAAKVKVYRARVKLNESRYPKEAS